VPHVSARKRKMKVIKYKILYIYHYGKNIKNGKIFLIFCFAFAINILEKEN